MHSYAIGNNTRVIFTNSLELRMYISTMLNYYFKDNIEDFLKKSAEEIIGAITLSNQFDATLFQNKSWKEQIEILQNALASYRGTIFFEFSIPRMGKRVDAIVIIQNVVFVIEFKVGESKFNSHYIEQVWDYALDLKNFHKPSHNALLVPILVATEAKKPMVEIKTTSHNDNLTQPILVNLLASYAVDSLKY
jgi:predicted transcriptional regulator